MKGGLATMLEARPHRHRTGHRPHHVFYAREEVAVIHNGLREIEAERPDLLDGDVALLGEPTLERSKPVAREPCGSRSPFRGPGPHCSPVDGTQCDSSLGRAACDRRGLRGAPSVVEGCEYREALQAVHVEGGVAGNVVPDSAMVRINHRFAPIDPARRPWPTCVLCWHRRWRMATRSRSPISRPLPAPGSVIRSSRRWSNGTASRWRQARLDRCCVLCGAGCTRLEFRSWRRHHRAHPGRICRASVGGRHPRCAARRDHQRRLIVPAARIRACASR